MLYNATQEEKVEGLRFIKTCHQEGEEFNSTLYSTLKQAGLNRMFTSKDEKLQLGALKVVDTYFNDFKMDEIDSIFRMTGKVFPEHENNDCRVSRSQLCPPEFVTNAHSSRRLFTTALSRRRTQGQVQETESSRKPRLNCLEVSLTKRTRLHLTSSTLWHETLALVTTFERPSRRLPAICISVTLKTSICCMPLVWFWKTPKRRLTLTSPSFKTHWRVATQLTATIHLIPPGIHRLLCSHCLSIFKQSP